MITVADIVARLRATGAEQVDSEFKSAEASSNRFGATMSKNGKKISDFGKKASLGLTTPIIGLAGLLVNSASDVNEATSAVSTTYGTGAKIIIDASMNAAQAAGISRNAYLQAATTLGVYANSAGLSGDAAAMFGKDLLSAASDMASFYNVPVDEALAAIKSGLTGEVEPLRKYGILLSEASLQQYALAKGIWDGSGAMTDQQKVLARQGYILDNLGAAQGDFSRTSGGLANQLRILKAEGANLAAQWGQILLPFALKLVHGLLGLAGVLANLPSGVQKVVLIFGALIAAIGPLAVGFGIALQAVGAIAAAFGSGGLLAALTPLLGPIALVVGALVLLGIAYKKNFLGFGDAVNAVAGKVASAVSGVYDSIAGFVRRFVVLFEMFAQMTNPVSAAFKTLSIILRNVGGKNPPRVLSAIISILDSATKSVEKFVARFSKAFAQITAGLRRIKRAFDAGGLKGAINELFGDAGKSILRGFAGMLSAPLKLIGDFLRGVTTGFKPLDTFLHSSGRVFQDVGNLIKKVISGDWSGALHYARKLFDDWIGALKAELGLLLGIFHAIPWGKLWDGLKKAIKSLVDVFKGIPYRDLAQRALDGLLGAFSAIPWGDLWNGLKDEASSLLGKIPGWIGTAAGSLLSIGSDLLQSVLDGWDSLKPTLTSYASGLVEWIKELVTGAPGALLDVGSDLLQSVLDGWDSLKDRLAGYASGLIGWIVGLVTGDGGGGDSSDASGPLGSVGSGLIGSLLAGWDSLKERLIGYASGLIGFIKGLISLDDAGAALKACGAAIIGGLLSGWDSLKAKVEQYASGLVSFISNLVTGCDSALLDKGAALLGSLLAGWDTVKDRVIAYASGLVDFIKGLVPGGDGVLADVGAKLLSSLLDGWDSIKPRLTEYASGLVSFIVGLVGTGASVLLDVGSNLLGSLLAGWDSIKPTLESYASGLIDYVVGLVPDVVSGAGNALFDKGAGILQSLLDGWNSVKDKLDEAVGLVTGAIDGIVGAVDGAISKLQSLWGMLPGVGGGGGKSDAPVSVDASAAMQAASDLSTAQASITASVTVIMTNLTDLQLAFTLAQTTVESVTAAITSALGTWQTDVGTYATNAGNDFNQLFYVGLLAGQKTLDAVISAMNTSLSTFQTSVGIYATDTGNGFNTKIYVGLLAGQRTVNAVISAIEKALGTFVGQVGIFATSAGNDFNTKIYTGLYAGQLTVEAVLNTIESDLGTFVSTVGSQAYSAGYSIGQGLNDGIAFWSSAIAATAAAAVSGAISAARTAADAHSPSRKMVALGKDMGIALPIGFKQGSDGFTDVALQPIRKAMKAISATLKAYKGENTPKEIVDAALSLDAVRKKVSTSRYHDRTSSGDLTAILKRTLYDTMEAVAASLKAYKGNETPKTIVGASKSLDSLLSVLAPDGPDFTYAKPAKTVSKPQPVKEAVMPRSGNTYIVMTRSELKKLFEASEFVETLTTPEEVAAAWGK